MKAKIKDNINSHGSCSVFATLAEAARMDINFVGAIISPDGDINFVDKEFERTVNALLKANAHRGIKLGFKTLVLNGVERKGYAYFDVHEVPDIVIEQDIIFSDQNKINESVEEYQTINERFDVLFESREIHSGIYPNAINMETGVGYKLADIPEYRSEDLEFVYKNAESHSKEDEKSVVGTYDSIKNEIIFDDEEIVDRINIAALTPITNEIGVSRIRGKDGYHVDFQNAKYRLTEIDEFEDEDLDGPKRCHFIELSDEIEEAPERARIEESFDELINSDHPGIRMNKEQMLKDVKNVKNKETIKESVVDKDGTYNFSKFLSEAVNFASSETMISSRVIREKAPVEVQKPEPKEYNPFMSEAVVTDDIVNKNPEVLGKTGPAPAQKAIYDEDPDKIYKQPAIEAAAAKAAKDKADFEARMKSYLSYAMK